MASRTHVALLRGINLGSANRLAMKDLAALFERAGCVDVRSYIQSGNLVFGASADVAKRLAERITADIERRFGMRVPVVLRTADELRAVARDNPFLAAGADADKLHIMFLADKPDKKACAALDPQRSLPDAFVVKGREVYLFLPNGAGKSKLSNGYFDSKLATISTARNWRTVLKLVEMSGA
jgi:uncharacterized protein (DUF1697 family)